jgi:hypothetical protein
VPEAATLAVANLTNGAHPSLLLEGTQVTLSDGRLHDAERGITFAMPAEPSAHRLIDGAAAHRIRASAGRTRCPASVRDRHRHH